MTTTLFAGTSVAELGGTAITTAPVDAAYTSEGVRYTNNEAGGLSHKPSSVVSTWYHFRIYTPQYILNTNADGNLWRWYDAGGGEVCRMEMLNGSVYCYTLGAGGDLSGGTFTLSNYTTFTIDVQIIVDPANGIEMNAYVNGVLSSTAIDTVGVGGHTVPVNWIWSHLDISTTSGDLVSYSEVIVSEESTIGLRLSQHKPNLQGFHTAWDNDFNSLLGDNELGISGGTGDKESFEVSDYAGPAGPTVKEVVIAAEALIPTVGPATLAGFTRVGGVDYAGPDMTPNDVEQSILSLGTVNPVTSLPWTEAELNALEVGVEAKA